MELSRPRARSRKNWSQDRLRVPPRSPGGALFGGVKEDALIGPATARKLRDMLDMLALMPPRRKVFGTCLAKAILLTQFDAFSAGKRARG